MSVTENLFLGRMPSRGPLVDRREARRQARAVLARVGLGSLDPDRRTSTLPLNVRQQVEIAKALARDARILVMDEPSAALQRDDIATLFSVVRDLRVEGIGVIFISHHLEEIFEVCDSAMVMRDGLGGRVPTDRPVDRGLPGARHGGRGIWTRCTPGARELSGMWCCRSTTSSGGRGSKGSR